MKGVIMEFKSAIEKKMAIRVEAGYARLMEYMLEEHMYSNKSEKDWTLIKLKEIREVKDRYYGKIRDMSSSRLRSIASELYKKDLIDLKLTNFRVGDLRFKIKSVRNFMSFWDDRMLENKIMKKGKIVK